MSWHDYSVGTSEFSAEARDHKKLHDMVRLLF